MRRQPLPSSLPSRRFLVSRALVSGAGRKRLRARDLRSPHHGVRAVGGEGPALIDRCRDYAPLLAEGHLFSHLTAAELWGLPLPLAPRGQIHALHVTATAAVREPRRPGVVGHTGSGIRSVRHLGVNVVGPVRAWIQCAELLEVDDLVIMGDALLSKWSPFAAARFHRIEDLRRLLDRCSGRRGIRRLREAIELMRPKSWSPKESELRLLIVRSGLREPDALNEKVYAADGSAIGRPDMQYKDARVYVEYEGDHHRTNKETFRLDIVKRERLADEGWRGIRVTELDLSEPASLLRRLSRYIPPA